jgi:hypothetical protein
LLKDIFHKDQVERILGQIGGLGPRGSIALRMPVCWREPPGDQQSMEQLGSLHEDWGARRSELQSAKHGDCLGLFTRDELK